MLAGRDGVATDRGNNGRVTQRRLRADHRVRDVVVNVLPAKHVSGYLRDLPMPIDGGDGEKEKGGFEALIGNWS